MQAGFGFTALVTYLLMYAGMPDTSHPGTRGVDKEFGGEFKWVWLNPFRCLWYMRSPNLLALVSQLCHANNLFSRAVHEANLLERCLPDVRWRCDSVV